MICSKEAKKKYFLLGGTPQGLLREDRGSNQVELFFS